MKVPPPPPGEEPLDVVKLRRLLRRGPVGLEALSGALEAPKGRVVDAIDEMVFRGANVLVVAGDYQLTKDPVPDDTLGPTLVSDKHGVHRFGVISDTHYCSKYARLDVVEALYDWYEAEGIETVYHCGNWVDGEIRFNQGDLLVHGMQAQIDYFVSHYPSKKDMTTLYVAGDDHEGWWAQREQIDPGKVLLRTARAAGREDLVYLGYKECYITLEHSETGETSKVLVDHPGGGSTARSIGYSAQLRIDSLQSGEKPGLWLFGHWHKIGYFMHRGVHVLLAGCTKDQDPFARKKGIQYHIGGSILEAHQDPQGGIGLIVPQIKHFFDRDYYQGGFSMDGPVKRKRAPHGRKR